MASRDNAFWRTNKVFSFAPPPMFDYPCGCKPSNLVTSSPLMSALYRSGAIAHDEIERRALGAKRLAEAFGQMTWHTDRAARDPDYWHTLYASRINW